MNTDFKPYSKLMTYYMRHIEARRLELAELMANRSGRTTKIQINAYKEGKMKCNYCGAPLIDRWDICCDESDLYE